MWCYNRHLKSGTKKYCSRIVTPIPLSLASRTSSYWTSNIPWTYYVIPNWLERYIKPRKRCTFRVTEDWCSSLTRHRYTVTSHMSGLTRKLSPTSFSSRISLRSITSPMISHIRCSLTIKNNMESTICTSE